MLEYLFIYAEIKIFHEAKIERSLFFSDFRPDFEINVHLFQEFI